MAVPRDGPVHAGGIRRERPGDRAALSVGFAGRLALPAAKPWTSPMPRASTPTKTSAGLWAAHHVRLHTKGIKAFNHPVVGQLELSFERLEVAADPGLMIVAYTAEPGSRSAEALDLLASWTATDERVDPAPSDAAASHDGRPMPNS